METPEPLTEAILRGYGLDPGPYHSASTTWLTELDDRTVQVGPPHQRMGTRLVDHNQWLLVDRHREAELGLRSRLYRERSVDVFACEPAAEEASKELLALVAGWGSEHGLAAPTVEGHPLVAAGLAVQEDLCIMQRDERGWRLSGAFLCFPSHWYLAEKFGRVQERLHEPVPHYEQDLAATVNRFFDRLSPGRIMARRNWSFTSDSLLFRPDRALVDTPSADLPLGPESFWVRSERQTLRRLSGTGAIVFTIKVQLAPIAALRSYSEVTARLLAAVHSWSPEMRSTGRGRLDDVVAWLEALVTQE